MIVACARKRMTVIPKYFYVLRLNVTDIFTAGQARNAFRHVTGPTGGGDADTVGAVTGNWPAQSITEARNRRERQRYERRRRECRRGRIRRTGKHAEAAVDVAGVPQLVVIRLMIERDLVERGEKRC